MEDHHALCSCAQLLIASPPQTLTRYNARAAWTAGLISTEETLTAQEQAEILALMQVSQQLWVRQSAALAEAVRRSLRAPLTLSYAGPPVPASKIVRGLCTSICSMCVSATPAARSAGKMSSEM